MYVYGIYSIWYSVELYIYIKWMYSILLPTRTLSLSYHTFLQNSLENSLHWLAWSNNDHIFTQGIILMFVWQIHLALILVSWIFDELFPQIHKWFSVILCIVWMIFFKSIKFSAVFNKHIIFIWETGQKMREILNDHIILFPLLFPLHTYILFLFPPSFKIIYLVWLHLR